VLPWLSLAVCLLLIVGAATYAALKGLELWRAFRELGRRTSEGLDRISRSAGGIEQHLQAAAASGTALDTSLQRLSRSRARLHVLTSAIADVRASVGRVAGVLPRK
jgi:hypothetical protein